MKYVKLMDDLKTKIMSGEIAQGDKLPSENVLSRTYGISRQTVRKAIELLGNEGLVHAEHGKGTFCSNRAKPKGTSKNVAVVMTYLSNYIFPYVIRGIDEVLEQDGYSIFLKSTHNSRRMEAKCLEDLIQKEIDGLIIEPSKSQIFCRNTNLYHMLDSYNIPYVFIQGIYHGMEDKPYVLLDDYKGGYEITQFLIESGHRKIAGVFKADDMQGRERHRGYVKALQDHQMIYDPNFVIWYHTEDMQTLPYTLIKELKKKEQFDAIVSYNDEIALEVIRGLEEIGVRVPQDISVTGFDDSAFGKNFRVPLTTVQHPQEQLGEAAANLLIQLMKGNVTEEDKHIIMEPKLVIRNSTQNRIYEDKE